MTLNPIKNISSISSFERSPITTNLTSWIDFSDQATLTLNTGRITAISDKSGLSNGFQTNQLPIAPYHIQNGMNGLTTARFLVNERHSLTGSGAGDSYITNTQYTIFAVVSIHSINSNNNPSYLNGPIVSDANGWGIWAATNGISASCGHWAFGANHSQSKTLIMSGSLLIVARRDGVNTSIDVDGISPGFINIISGEVTSTSTIKIGNAEGNIGSQKISFDIGEIIFYNVGLSDTDVLINKSYLRNKWNTK